MDTNLSEVFKEMLESQIKKSESEIKIKSALALSEIEIIIETATSVSEIIKFEKQYDEVERKFEKEILKQKRKIIQEYMSTMEKLKKHLEKSIYKNDFQ